MLLNELPINHETKSKYDALAYAMEKTAHKTIPNRNRLQPGCLKRMKIVMNKNEKRNSDLSLKSLDQQDDHPRHCANKKGTKICH